VLNKNQLNLPELFQFNDSSPVTTAADWTRRRTELLDVIQQVEYGFLPPKPARMQTAVRSANTSLSVFDAPIDSIPPGVKIRFRTKLLI